MRCDEAICQTPRQTIVAGVAVGDDIGVVTIADERQAHRFPTRDRDDGQITEVDAVETELAERVVVEAFQMRYQKVPLYDADVSGQCRALAHLDLDGDLKLHELDEDST